MRSIIPNGMGESREIPSVGGHPKVSVGMPVYNGERYLEAALDSVLAQSFDDFEVVISDNASTDRTEEICKGYAHEDERIKYFRMRKNYGVNYNFNNVFRLSAGEYFKWASSDDVFEHDYFRKAVDVLDGTRPSYSCGQGRSDRPAWDGRSYATRDLRSQLCRVSLFTRSNGAIPAPTPKYLVG